MTADFFITIFDGEHREFSVNLASFGKNEVSFGRMTDNDIVLTTNLVSSHHGVFRLVGDSWIMLDNNSTNGVFWNGRNIRQKRLADGDKLIIGYEQSTYRVAFICSQGEKEEAYEHFSLYGRQYITIGRASECDITVNHTAVYKQHCMIFYNGMGYYIRPCTKEAIVQFNDAPLPGTMHLSEMDRFVVGDTMFIYQNGTLHYTKKSGGLGFEVSHLSKIVGRMGKQKRINSDINLRVNAGEFVAIIGGSGAGKSTLMNCLCGNSEISEGNVYINGEDLASNYNSLKQLIGHVPQEDIVYDNLKLERMLYYTAKLRMPQDSTDGEIQGRIDSALSMVELLDKRDVMIKSLSGGQKKRASIAVELLSDPKLFFLDEPTSGLDPGTERNLMMTLKRMTKAGKTVVLVTHTPLNLHLCDKVIIMGYGGKLCYCGSPNGAMQFFNVKNLVDIYNLVNNDADRWAAMWERMSVSNPDNMVAPPGVAAVKTNSLRQFGILTQRYFELQFNDIKTLLLKLILAPAMGVIVYIVFRASDVYKYQSSAQKMMFVIACCAFFIGLFNTVQEICKEQQIYRRERMANLRVIPYVSSKLVLNAILEGVQSGLLMAVVIASLGAPDEDLAVVKMFVTTYLTMFSASCMGLMISALVGNSDQAVNAITIVIIPQILFSGVIVEFDAEDITNYISYLISCRHACVSYCVTADVNSLQLSETMPMARVIDMYDAAVSSGWVGLIAISIVSFAAALTLLKLKKQK